MTTPTDPVPARPAPPPDARPRAVMGVETPAPCGGLPDLRAVVAGERRLRNRAFMKALAPGLPMVVLPYGRDQAENAACVMACGASVAVKRTARAAVGHHGEAGPEQVAHAHPQRRV